MKEDIKTAIEYDYEIDREKDRYEIEEELNDEFWCWDSITGNGSGSYTFSTEKAIEFGFRIEKDEFCRHHFVKREG